MVHTDSALLWRRLRETGDAEAREALIAQHLPFARLLASVAFARHGFGGVDFDDFLQLARMGLVESVDRFDPARGVRFRTFAAHRIQGAVRNGLASMSERSQQGHAAARLRAERLESLRAALPAADAEPPPVLPLFEALAEVAVGLAVGFMLEGTGLIDGAAFGHAVAEPSAEALYFRRHELQLLGRRLRDLLGLLVPQQRSVLYAHYMQAQAFEQIARNLGVSRGRVSQIHRQGLARLRTLLGSQAACELSF